MNNFFNPGTSLFVTRSTISDFNAAFRNLRPTINSKGNSVSIRHRGKETIVPLSQPRHSFGFTR